MLLAFIMLSKRINKNSGKVKGAKKIRPRFYVNNLKKDNHFGHWLAGLFDSAGSFDYKAPPGQLTCEIILSDHQLQVVYKLKHRFGGKITIRQKNKQVRWRRIWYSPSSHPRSGCSTSIDQTNSRERLFFLELFKLIDGRLRIKLTEWHAFVAGALKLGLLSFVVGADHQNQHMGVRLSSPAAVHEVNFRTSKLDFTRLGSPRVLNAGARPFNCSSFTSDSSVFPKDAMPRSNVWRSKRCDEHQKKTDSSDPRPYDRRSFINNYWLSGFFDACGSFELQKVKKPSHLCRCRPCSPRVGWDLMDGCRLEPEAPIRPNHSRDCKFFYVPRVSFVAKGDNVGQVFLALQNQMGGVVKSVQKNKAGSLDCVVDGDFLSRIPVSVSSVLLRSELQVNARAQEMCAPSPSANRECGHLLVDGRGKPGHTLLPRTCLQGVVADGSIPSACRRSKSRSACRPKPPAIEGPVLSMINPPNPSQHLSYSYESSDTDSFTYPTYSLAYKSWIEWIKYFQTYTIVSKHKRIELLRLNRLVLFQRRQYDKQPRTTKKAKRWRRLLRSLGQFNSRMRL